VQVAEGVSQTGLAAFESGWLLQCPQGKLALPGLIAQYNCD